MLNLRERMAAAWRTDSDLALFRGVLVVRWLLLAVIPVTSGILSPDAGPRAERVWLGIGAAAAYLLVLTLFDRRVSEAVKRGPWLAIVDFALLTALYFIDNGPGPGTSEPFWVLSTSTLLIPGLYGGVAIGLAGGLAWSSTSVVVCLLRGWPAAQVFGWGGLQDFFGVIMLSTIWAYGVGSVRSLDRVRRRLNEDASALTRTRAEVDRRKREIVALLDVGEAMLDRSDSDEILGVVLTSLVDMGFSSVRIWFMDDGRAVPVLGGRGASATRSEDDELLAEAVAAGRQILIEEDTVVCGEAVHAPAVVVPIAGQDEAAGLMVVESGDGSGFSDERLELLGLFAEQVSMSRRHLELRAHAGEYAVAEERNRLTRALHDTVVRRLRGASLLLDTALGSDGPEDVHARLGQVRACVAGALTDLRFSVLEWEGSEGESDVAGTVQRYVEEFATLSGLSVVLDVRGSARDLDQEACRDLLRVLQEALSNVWRHSGAQNVRVQLAFEASGVTLSITDDGRGFDTTHARTAGIGLRGMRSRGERHSGRFSLVTGPGEGTRVQVWMPC